MAVGESVPFSGAEADARWKADVARRLADLERQSQRKTSPPPCGFYVTRTVNEGTLAAGLSFDVTFNNVVEATWSTFAGFVSGAGLTVPAEGAGWYAIAAGAYWAANIAGVFVGATVNATFSVAPTPTPQSAVDRAYCSGLVRLSVGDVVRLHVANTSGTPFAVTAYSGDINTPPLPFLKAWRIST